MEQYSVSITKGDGNIRHNADPKKREHLNNVENTRIQNNVNLIHENIRKAYHTLFDDAVNKYNENQKRSNRKIDNYYNKIYHSEKEKTFYEFVVQVGNMNEHPDINVTNQILTDFLKTFQEKYPNFYVFGAYIHNDESTPHMHLDYIPFAHYGRGQEVRVSLTQALVQSGYEFQNKSGRKQGHYESWHADLVADLEEICLSHNVERVNMHNTDKHQSNVRLYAEKKELEKAVKQLQSEVNQLSKTKSNMEAEITTTKSDIEQLETNKSQIEIYIQQLEDRKEKVLISPTETILEDPKAKQFIAEFNDVLADARSDTYGELELKFSSKDNSWLDKDVEVYDEHISLLKTEKYVKMPYKKWEEKKEKVHYILNRTEKIKSFFIEQANGFMQTWNEINIGPSVLKFKEFEKAKSDIKDLKQSLNQKKIELFKMSQEKSDLYTENQELQWYKKVYQKILPVLDKSITNGQNTLQYVLNKLGFHQQDKQFIQQDLIDLKKERSRHNDLKR